MARALAAWWKEAVAAVVALPLVLPPTVLGFYLLVALGPNGPGGCSPRCGARARWPSPSPGLVIGSVLYSMPFVVQPIRNAFEAMGDAAARGRGDVAGLAAATRSGPSPCRWRGPGFLTGAVLGFAHTVGEFGVVLMIGGNIPGETKVLSVAIYDYVETLAMAQAHVARGRHGGLLLLRDARHDADRKAHGRARRMKPSAAPSIDAPFAARSGAFSSMRPSRVPRTASPLCSGPPDAARRACCVASRG